MNSTELTLEPEGSPDPPAGAPPTVEAEQAVRFRRIASHACQGLVLLAVVWVAMLGWKQGRELRRHIWDQSERIYYHGDIGQAYHHGARVMEIARAQAGIPVPAAGAASREPTFPEFFRGYVALYSSPTKPGDEGRFALDYPPLRLLVVSLWVRHVQVSEPWRTEWDANRAFGFFNRRPRDNPAPQSAQIYDRDIALPLLAFNTFCGSAAAVGMFLLVWCCMRREQTNSWLSDAAVTVSPLHVAWWACAPLAGAYFWFRVNNIVKQGEWPSGFVMAGLLCLFIVTVASVRSWPTPCRYWGCGLIGALMVWFNTALLIDGYAWPQWDVWLLPPFIFAAFFAAADWWFLAGLLIGIGGMFKGQTFLVAPLFALWPLFQLRPGACARWIAGAVFASAVVVSPWLLRDAAARKWMYAVAAAALLLLPWCFLRMRRADAMRVPGVRGWGNGLLQFVSSPRGIVFLVSAAVAVALVERPVFRLGERLDRVGCAIVIVVLVGCPILFKLLEALSRSPVRRGEGPVAEVDEVSNSSADPSPQPSPLSTGEREPEGALRLNLKRTRRAVTWLCFILGMTAFLAGRLFNADWAWLTVGFEAGTEKHDVMTLGNNPSLCGLLNARFQFGDIHEIVGPIPMPFGIEPRNWEIKKLLAAIYGVCLVLCAIGCAMHHHRRDARLLIALVTPWLLFPAILTQMSARYWLWSATLSAAFVGVSVGMSLFQFLLTTIATIAITERLLEGVGRRAMPEAFQFTGRFYPDASWTLLLLALIYLYLSLAPRRRRVE